MGLIELPHGEYYSNLACLHTEGSWFMGGRSHSFSHTPMCRLYAGAVVMLSNTQDSLAVEYYQPRKLVQ